MKKRAQKMAQAAILLRRKRSSAGAGAPIIASPQHPNHELKALPPAEMMRRQAKPKK